MKRVKNFLLSLNDKKALIIIESFIVSVIILASVSLLIVHGVLG